MAVTPWSTRAGVFGITRMSRGYLPRIDWMVAVDTPAAIEIRSGRFVRAGMISRSTEAMICGLTARMTTSAPRTSAALSASALTPNWSASWRARSARTSAARILSAGTRFDSTRPRMSASPMLPAPTKPTFLPLTLIASPLRHVRDARRARAEDRGAHAHHGGALLDGDLEVAAHPHRQLRQPVALRQLAQRAEPAARVLGALDGGRDRHQSAQPQPAERRQRLHRRLDRLRRPAALRRLQADVDLHERVHRTAPRAGAAVELAREVDAIDGVDHVEQLERVTDLVRLEVADEVPRHRPPELGDLAARLLHPVLAEHGQPCRQGRADACDLDRLGHADEQHVLGAPPGPLRRARDAFPHALEIGPDVRLHIQHGRF